MGKQICKAPLIAYPFELIYQSLTSSSMRVNYPVLNLGSPRIPIWKSPMPRKTFSQEMQEVKNETLLLSSMVEQAVINSAGALKDNDLEQARQILLNDIGINRKRFEIELSIMILIATQQPTAHD